MQKKTGFNLKFNGIDPVKANNNADTTCFSNFLFREYIMHINCLTLIEQVRKDTWCLRFLQFLITGFYYIGKC